MDSKLLTKNRPPTRQWGGHAYTETWTNCATVAQIVHLNDAGYSSEAIAEYLCEQFGVRTSGGTIRKMLEKWGIRPGRPDDKFHYIKVPMKTRDRSNLQDRACQEGLSMAEYARRVLVAVILRRDTFAKLVSDPSQFD